MAESGKLRQRVRAALRRYTRLSWWNPDRVLSVVFGILGIVGVAAPFLWEHKSPQQMAAITIGMLLTTVLVLALVVGFLITKVTREEVGPTGQSLLDTANNFSRLVHLETRFHLLIAAYVAELFRGKSNDEKWKEIEGLFQQVMKQVCDTAAGVITAKRGDAPQKVSANIKVFLADEKTQEVVYMPRWRSQYSNKNRDAEDAETRRNEFRVKRNMVYDSIVTCVTGEAFCLIPDMRRYFDEDMKKANAERSRKGEPPYMQPAPGALNYYLSCLVVPIWGIHHNSSDANGPGMAFRDGTTLGTLCIDCKEANYFDDAYDYRVMSQLAEHAYGALRAYTAVNELHEFRILKRARRRKPRPSVAEIEKQPAAN